MTEKPTWGVEKNRKKLRRQRAEERKALREARTNQEQLTLIDSRRGASAKERKRLLKAVGT